MIAVAIIAIAMAAERTRQRWSERRQKAWYYARCEQLCLDDVRKIKLQMIGGRSGFDLALSHRKWMAERAGQLKRTWATAAASPWSPEPTEPPPEWAQPPPGK